MKPLYVSNIPPKETDFVLIERTVIDPGPEESAQYIVAVILDEIRLECVEGSGDLDTYAEAKLLADDWAWRLRLPVREAAAPPFTYHDATALSSFGKPLTYLAEGEVSQPDSALPGSES